MPAAGQACLDARQGPMVAVEIEHQFRTLKVVWERRRPVRHADHRLGEMGGQPAQDPAQKAPALHLQERLWRSHPARPATGKNQE